MDLMERVDVVMKEYMRSAYKKYKSNVFIRTHVYKDSRLHQ